MKVVESIPTVFVRTDGATELTLSFSDGSSDSFAISTERLPEVLNRITEAYLSAHPKAQVHPDEYAVLVHDSNPHVMLRLGVGERTIQVVLGHTIARKLGEELIVGAEKSIAPRTQQSH
jgi:hypothetical protein